MGEYIVFGHWAPKAGRVDEFLTGFKPVIDYARRRQSDIPCLYLLKEDTNDDEPKVLTISSFKSSQAYLEFLESPECRNLKAFHESNHILQISPQDEVVELATGFMYRPDPAGFSCAFTVIASIRYEPGTREKGIKHWNRVTEFVERGEQDTSTYCFLRSQQDENILFSLERYSSKGYFKEVHVPSEAIAMNIKNQKDIRTPGGLSHRFWKEVGNSRLPQ